MMPVGPENSVTAVTREFPPTMDPTTSPWANLTVSAPELWSFTYLAARRVLSLLVLALRRSGSKEIEILVLRHELEILRRNQPRPCLQPADRAWLATPDWLVARERWSAYGVRPETPSLAPVASPPDTGRTPNVSSTGRRSPTSSPRLIVAMATDNPAWGYQRVRGELLHLGHRVAASTIARVLKTHDIKPAPRRTSATWRRSAEGAAPVLG